MKLGSLSFSPLLAILTPSLVAASIAYSSVGWASAPHHDEQEAPSASSLAALVRAEVRRQLAEPIQLRDPIDSSVNQCSEFSELLTASQIVDNSLSQRGEISAKPALALLSGPSGSGQYWTNWIVVLSAAKRIGGCIPSKSAGLRSIPSALRRRLPSRKPFQRGRLILWTEIVVGATETESLLFPSAYRLQGDSLVVDNDMLRIQMRRFAKAYGAISRAPSDQHSKLHRAASRAYSLVAAELE